MGLSLSGINGIDGMTYAEIRHDVLSGGRFVVFTWVVSVLVLSFRRSSQIYYLRPGERGFLQSLPSCLVSLLLGWWGIPFGLLWTPVAIFSNLNGGKNVTDSVMASLTNG